MGLCTSAEKNRFCHVIDTMVNPSSWFTDSFTPVKRKLAISDQPVVHYPVLMGQTPSDMYAAKGQGSGASGTRSWPIGGEDLFLRKAQVDLSGHWILSEVDGCMSFLQQDLGLTEQEMWEAHRRQYGLGKRMIIIRQKGNDVTMEMRLANGRTTHSTFTVGMMAQHSKGFKNQDVILDAWWKEGGRTLHIKTVPVHPQPHAEPVREFYKDGDKLVLELQSEHGRRAKKTFTRVDSLVKTKYFYDCQRAHR